MDNIADMLTIIRNAQQAGKREAVLRASNLKLAIAKILEKEGFIESVLKEKDNNIEKLKLRLKYYEISKTKKIPAIKGLQKISKEGQRIYIGAKKIKSVKNNFGISIISTPKGVMTGFEARKNNVGGEYICEVW